MHGGLGERGGTDAGSALPASPSPGVSDPSPPHAVAGTYFSTLNWASCPAQRYGICTDGLIAGTATACNVVYLMRQAFNAVPEHTIWDLPTCGMNVVVPVVVVPNGPHSIAAQPLLLTFPHSWRVPPARGLARAKGLRTDKSATTARATRRLAGAPSTTEVTEFRERRCSE